MLVTASLMFAAYSSTWSSALSAVHGAKGCGFKPYVCCVGRVTLWQFASRVTLRLEHDIYRGRRVKSMVD